MIVRFWQLHSVKGLGSALLCRIGSLSVQMKGGRTFKESLCIVGVIRLNNYKLEPLAIFLLPPLPLKCFAKLTTSTNFIENGLLFLVVL